MYICIIDFPEQNIVFISDSFSVWCRKKINLVTTREINSHLHYLLALLWMESQWEGEWRGGTHTTPCTLCGYLPRWVVSILSSIVESSPLASRVVLEGGYMPSDLLSSFFHTWLFFHGVTPQAADCHSQLTSKPLSRVWIGFSSSPTPLWGHRKQGCHWVLFLCHL